MSKSGDFSEEGHGHAGAGSEEITKTIKGLEHLSSETHCKSQYLKVVLVRKMETDCLVGPVAIGQGDVALN